MKYLSYIKIHWRGTPNLYFGVIFWINDLQNSMIWRQIILFGPGIILLSLVNHTVLATDKFSCLDEFPAVSNRAEFIKPIYYDRTLICDKKS